MNSQDEIHAAPRGIALKVRLTLWYGIALGVILAIFAGTLYMVLARGLKDQVDRSLEEAATVAVKALEERRVGPYVRFDDLVDEFPELAVLDKFFQIFSPTGTITIQSPNIRRRDIPLSRTALGAALVETLVISSEGPLADGSLSEWLAACLAL